MKGCLMGMLAETPLHPGVGQQVGAVDLPVARDTIKGYPIIPASSIKGCLRDKVDKVARGPQRSEKLFGTPGEAGMITMTDARILLLPVRSLSGIFRWVTCPDVLERFARDCLMLGIRVRIPELSVGKVEAFTPREEKTLFLEELSFDTAVKRSEIEEVVSLVVPLVLHDTVKRRLKEQLVVVSNDIFAHFARYGLPVVARNYLDDKKTSKNLWYEELIPPDTLMYSVLFSESVEALNDVRCFLEEEPYLQVGGNETIGRGWCALRFTEDLSRC